MVAVARELHDAHPENVTVLQTLGAARMAIGEHTTAVESFRKAAALSPQSPKAYWLLANAQTEAGDYAEANASLNRALELESGYLPAEVGLVLLKQRMKRPQEALEGARKIQQQHPEKPQGFVLEGDIQMAEKAYAEAAESYAAGLSRQESSDLVVKLFQARRKAGETKLSLESLEQWLGAHPDDVKVRQVLAQALFESGDLAAATSHYRTVVSAQPDNATALNNLAWLLREEDPRRALEYAESANELRPGDPIVMDTLGTLLLMQGEKKRALKVLKEARQKSPNDRTLLYHYAWALAENGELDQARATLLIIVKREFPERKQAQALLDSL